MFAPVTLFGESVTFTRVPSELILERLAEGPSSNSARFKTLVELFEEVGCDGTALTEQEVRNSREPNIICTRLGDLEETIIVGAHFDKGRTGGGIVDNWSGAALLPSLYQSLGALKLRHKFLFVGFTGEEVGLLGSKTFVKAAGKAELKKVAALINLDTLGLSSSKVWSSRSDPRLVNILAAIARAMNVPLTGVNIEAVGTTDSEPFRRKGVPVITIHSVTRDNLRILHTQYDALKAVNSEDYLQTYLLVAAFLTFLDGELSKP